MSLDINQTKPGSCKCGRSPTGICIGWHNLTKEAYESKLVEYNKQLEVTQEEEEAFKELERRNK